MLFLSLFIALLIFLGFSLKIFLSSINNSKDIISNLADADITKPKFTINGNNQEIAITASKGNFLSSIERF